MFYIGDLFQWERFITPSIIKLFYWLVVIMVVLAGLSGLVSALGIMMFNPIAGAFTAIASFAGMLVGILFARIVAGIHPDGVPDQRAPGGDPQSRRYGAELSALIPAPDQSGVNSSGDPVLHGRLRELPWMPAFAGMSGKRVTSQTGNASRRRQRRCIPCLPGAICRCRARRPRRRP